MPRLANPADQKCSPKIRVSLVDDSEAFWRVATDFFAAAVPVGRRQRDRWGEEALAQAQDLQPQVILIGVDMPGLETISQLRKVLPGVGSIALSLMSSSTYR